MQRSDAERFRRAQTYHQLSREERVPVREGAEDWQWFQDRCHHVIAGYFPEREKARRRDRDRGDRINDVWAALLRRLPKLRCKLDCGDITPWLKKIIERILYGFTRRPRRAPSAPLDAAAKVPAPDGSAALAQTQLGEELRAALAFYEAELTPTNCVLIRMHWLEGVPLKDAAAALGLSENTGKCRQRRAFRKLRKLLPRHPEWPLLDEWIETNFPKKSRISKNSRHLLRPRPLS